MTYRMTKYIDIVPGQKQHGVLRPILRLPVYYEAPSRTALERLPLVHQSLLKAYPDRCSAEVASEGDGGPDNNEGAQRRYGYVGTILLQIAKNGEVRQKSLRT